MLSNDLNVTHGLEGGVYYVFFVTNDTVIFEARNDADQADVYSVSITGGERHLLTTSTVGFGFGGEVALSKNGDYLIYKDGGNLFTVATNGSTPPFLVATVDRLTDHFSLSSDGEFIFYTQDYRLYRVTISGESIEVFDAEAPIQTNFTVSQLGTTQYIITAAPNSDQTIGYIQSPDAPMEILFQSVWDYQYGRYVFPVDDEHIIFRAYNGDVTHIFYQQIGNSPIELGCVVEGHVRFLDVINTDDPMLVYSVDDRDLYIIELEH